MHDAREKMLREIQALEFMEVELNLYLNTHPYDQQALMIFMNTARQQKMLRDNYERMYGPLTASSSNSFPWPWIESPWPWVA
ncbi:MAG TPA: spore coat protein CotJB [Clostridiales bacterium]|nr:spore coat protein CotJB [Clostridiales bacterium]